MKKVIIVIGIVYLLGSIINIINYLRMALFLSDNQTILIQTIPSKIDIIPLVLLLLSLYVMFVSVILLRMAFINANNSKLKFWLGISILPFLPIGTLFGIFLIYKNR